MKHLSTAREALIVETIGEVAALIDRVEALAPTLDTSRRALVEASAELAGQVATLEHHTTTMTETAKVQAVKHIARRTEEMARSSLDAQTRAMEDAARAIFSNEVGPALQRPVAPLQHLTDRGDRARKRWLTHAATSASA